MVTPLYRNPSPMLRSPARRALSLGLDVSDNHDLRWYFRFDTAPIAVVRQYAADVGLGCFTRAFGLLAEREFCKQAYRYYELRDKQGAVDLWMTNIGGAYVATFTRVSGAVTGLDICISPPLAAVALPAAYVTEARRCIGWLLPWFEELGSPGLVVTVCESEQAAMRFTMGTASRQVFDAIV